MSLRDGGPVWFTIVLAGAFLAGCTNIPTEQMIYLGGLHWRFDGDQLLITASMINIGATTLEDRGLPAVDATIHLEGWDHLADESMAGSSRSFEHLDWNEDWPPGHFRAFTVSLPVAPGADKFRISIRALITTRTDFVHTDRHSPCFSRESPDVGGCRPSYRWDERSLPHEDAAWLPRLKECCDWRPPPFDVTEIGCEGTTCRVKVLNWDNETFRPTGLYHVVLGGRVPERVLENASLPRVEAVPPGGEATFEFQTSAATAAVAAQRDVEARLVVSVWPDTVPRARSDGEAPLRLSAPPTP